MYIGECICRASYIYTHYTPSIQPLNPPNTTPQTDITTQGKELAFAFGINLSCSRLGSVVNNFVEPEVADKWGGVNVALFFGVVVLVVGCVCV